MTRHARAARAASLRRKKAQVLARATAPSTGRRHARPHHCHERRARPPPGRGTSRRGLRVPGPPQRARARADRCRLRRALASSSARGPAAASDGWRGLRMLAARRDQLSKRTDVCATGERRWQGGGAVSWHTVGVDGRARSTPWCTSRAPAGRLRAGQGPAWVSAREWWWRARLWRWGVPLCNFLAAQGGLSAIGRPVVAARRAKTRKLSIAIGS